MTKITAAITGVQGYVPEDAGHRRDEGAHHRHEAGQDDRLVSVLLEEGTPELAHPLAQPAASPAQG